MHSITNQHEFKHATTKLSSAKPQAQSTNPNPLSSTKKQVDNFAMSLQAHILYGSDTSTIPQPDRDISAAKAQSSHWNKKFAIQTNINTANNPINVVIRDGNILISRTGGNAPEDFVPLTSDTDLSDLSQETLDKLNDLISMVEQNAHSFSSLTTIDNGSNFTNGLPKASMQFTPQAVDKQEISRIFAEQRQHLIDTYQGDELNQRLAELNRNFEATIRESMKASFGFFTILSEDGQILDHVLADHVEKQTNIFLTSYMNNIQSYSFDSAFRQSIQTVMESLSLNYRNISWDDFMRRMNGDL